MKLSKIAALTVMSTLALTGCTAQTPTPLVYACGKNVEKPSEFTPYCADLGQDFTKVSWSSWNADKAVGKATVVTNLCDPTCSAGKFDTTSATITLSNPNGGMFTKLVVHYDKVPAGHTQDESVSIAVGAA